MAYRFKICVNKEEYEILNQRALFKGQSVDECLTDLITKLLNEDKQKEQQSPEEKPVPPQLLKRV